MSVHNPQEKSTARRVVCAVLTVCDIRSMHTDECGSIIVHALEAAGHEISEYNLVPNDPMLLNGQVRQLLHDDFIELICVTSHDGLPPRQSVAGEVVEHFIEKPLEGFSQLYRILLYEQIGARAMFSCAFGGRGHGKLLFALPGSADAVRLAMDKLIVPSFPEVLEMC